MKNFLVPDTAESIYNIYRNNFMDTSLRHLAPKEHDRVCELLKKYPCEYPQLTTHLQVLKILKIASKYLELLEKMELFILRKAGFNFIVRNIPDYGELCETGQRSKIGYQEMKDTLCQFGELERIDIIKGTVYAKFDNPEPCHKLINNMQMGANIINSRLIC